MYVEQHVVNILTDAQAAATEYTAAYVRGQILAIAYVKPAQNGLDTATIAITTETTQQELWAEGGLDVSKTVAPRQATHTTKGAAALYADGGPAVLAPIVVVSERIKIAVTNGGAAKTGTFTILVG